MTAEPPHPEEREAGIAPPPEKPADEHALSLGERIAKGARAAFIAGGVLGACVGALATLAGALVQAEIAARSIEAEDRRIADDDARARLAMAIVMQVGLSSVLGEAQAWNETLEEEELHAGVARRRAFSEDAFKAWEASDLRLFDVAFLKDFGTVQADIQSFNNLLAIGAMRAGPGDRLDPETQARLRKHASRIYIFTDQLMRRLGGVISAGGRTAGAEAPS